MSLLCDGCRRPISGPAALSVHRAEGERLDFCASPACAAAAWSAVNEITKPGRFEAMRRRAMNIQIRPPAGTPGNPLRLH